MFSMFHHKRAGQSTPAQWKEQWQALVPPECRDVPISCDGETMIAFVQKNHFVVMLQDGLLMEASFFDVCKFFQKAGYHVVWLMRCTQDITNHYLKKVRTEDGGRRTRWAWNKPTTNFGRWISDNYGASILIQTELPPKENLLQCQRRILQRVTWAESDDATRMIPGYTSFITTDNPGTPQELLDWISGTPLHSLRSEDL